MKTSTYSNIFYDLSSIPEKNRIYLSIKGYIPMGYSLNGFIDEITGLLDDTMPCFTMLADFSTLKFMCEDVIEKNELLYKQLQQNGLTKLAIVQPNEPRTCEQLKQIVSLSRIPFQLFSSVHAAEKWLSQPDKDKHGKT